VAEIALVARARGVGTRLLSRQALESLAEAEDVTALARGLTRLGAAIDPIGERPDVMSIEQAAARTAARHLQTLRRWQERSPGVLDVFAADQDRRNLRALVRGAAHGVPAAARLDGLLPTPLLPARALTALASQSSPADVVRQLVLLNHPDAVRLLPHVQQAQPDLFAVDLALLRGFRSQATASARADTTLRDFVNEIVDLGNVQLAVLVAGGPRDVDAADAYVEGGRWLPRDAFLAAARAVSPPAALSILSASLAGSPLAASLPAIAGDLAQLDRTFLSDRMAKLTDVARIDPLGTAPILLVLLRLAAQSRDLRTLAWGAALGTPPLVRRAHLVTPP
jgi:vacuolar-type H+-ATPase subunit C/Vma6